jgi:putative ABC transport system ATP-binding protein
MSAERTPEETPVAELERVTRTYRMGTNEVRALDELSFSFGRGEYWAVMGSSGSGKSTLLNLLGCLDRPTSGRYRVDGTDVSSLSDDELSEIRSQKLGFVFQSYNLVPVLSALENVEFVLLLQGVARAERRARALRFLDELGLGELAHKRPGEMSGGQQQRVAVARALAGEPLMLLADEPTGNLDSANGEGVMELLRDLHRAGATIAMVTHDPRFARYAERSVHLFDGQVVEEKGGR